MRQQQSRRIRRPLPNGRTWLEKGMLSSMMRWLQDLGVDVTPRLQTVRVEEPPKRKGGIMVSSIEELVDKLKNEAKVL